MTGLCDVSKPGGEDWPLAEAIDRERQPAHVAMIMDGNGRWARSRFSPRVAGHRAGIEPVRIAVEICARRGMRAPTLYAFSVENWKRPQPEVETPRRQLRVFLRRELPDPMHNEIRLQAMDRGSTSPSTTADGWGWWAQ